MARLPDGALTFLLTDIQGSTALWERHPEVMHTALSRHDGILQGLITHHRGNPYKTTGDGVYATFSRPRDALDAAMAIQRVMGAMSWGELGVLLIRVVIHTGLARLRDGDYYGPTINRASRLLAMAEGGQILASEATVANLPGDLPPTIVMRSIGDVHLRDVPEPFYAYLITPAPSEALTASAESDVSTRTDTVTPRPPDQAGVTFSAMSATSFTTLSVTPQPPLQPQSRRQPQPAHYDLRIYTLGEFRVEQGARTITQDAWGGSQARQLFKCLVTRRTHRLPNDDIFELFFPDSADAAASTLRSTIYRLRRILEPDVASANSVIVANRDGVSLRRDAAIWIDAVTFERLIADARRADDPLPLLDEADRLYQGDFLPDDPLEEWAVARREALRQVWVELQLERAHAHERQSRPEEAAAIFRRLLTEQRSDERAARELMLLLAQTGRRGEALLVYQRLAEVLRTDLDVEPSAETEAVRARILEADGADRQPERRPQVGHPHGSYEVQTSRAQATQTTATQLQPPMARLSAPLAGPSGGTEAGPPGLLPLDLPFRPSYPFPSPDLLVGRQREILTLRRLIDRGRAAGQIALLGGPAGNGKSTLAGSLIEHAQGRGYLTLAGGSYDREGLVPFGPVRDALADYLLSLAPTALQPELVAFSTALARVVPELAPHLGLPEEQASETVDAGRLFGAVHSCLRLLAARQPVLLCLEDLHAADGATLGLIHFLARQIRREAIVVLCSYRTDEVEPGQPLASLLATLAREGHAEQLILAPLGRDETTDLVSALLDGPPSDDLSGALFATSEGNPLFVEQLVLSLREDGRLQRQGGVWRHTESASDRLPPIVREVIERRFGRLSDRCREVLEVASIIGQTFDYPLLIEAQRERNGEVVGRHLDEAIRAQVVHEKAGGYAFSHAMLREALYRSMSGPLRGLLHARVGGAMERLAGEYASDYAAELAHHFALAVSVAPTAPKALRYSLEAGRRALNLSAHREALAHFTRACDFADRNGAAAERSPEMQAARIEAIEGRAWVERQLGMWMECIATCQTLLELSADPVRRAPTRSIISRAYRSLGDTARALQEVEDGLAELVTEADSQEAVRARVRLMYDRSYLLFLQGRFRAVAELGQEMFTVAQSLGAYEQAHLPCATMIIAGMGLHDVSMVMEYFGQGITAAERADARLPQAIFRENAGITWLRSGRYNDAAEQLRRSLELYGDTASDVRAVNAVQSLGRVLLAQGDISGALAQADRALAHATEGRDRWAAECYDLLGGIETVRGSWSNAIRHFDRALAIHEEAGDLADMVDSLTGLGYVSELSGAWAAAESNYRRALTIAERMDRSPEQVPPRRNLARIEVRRGQQDVCAALLDESLALAEAMRPTTEYGPTLLVLAELQARRQSWDLASETLAQALTAGGPADFLVEAYAVAAEVAALGGQTSLAAERAQASEARAEALGAPRLLGRARLASAQLAAHDPADRRTGSLFDSAIRYLADAQAPYELAVAMREYGRLLLANGHDPVRGRALVGAARLRFEAMQAQPDAAACEPLA